MHAPGTAANGDHRAVVANDSVCIEITFHFCKKVDAELLLCARTRALIKMQDRRAVMIMGLASTDHKRLQNARTDSALLHPCRCVPCHRLRHLTDYE